MTPEESVPRPEAVAAARWWADKLAAGSIPDNGQRDERERQTTAFAVEVASLTRRKFTSEQIEAFYSVLSVRIEAHLRRWETGVWEGTWQAEGPLRGSAVRNIANDYGAHPVLSAAAESVGIKLRTLDLPIKTVMWINPGEVTVAEGYGAEPATIWTTERNTR